MFVASAGDQKWKRENKTYVIFFFFTCFLDFSVLQYKIEWEIFFLANPNLQKNGIRLTKKEIPVEETNRRSQT